MTAVGEGAAVIRAAPAKLNLYLHVTGKRGDGYHLLDSLVAFAGVHDTVVAVPAETLSLRLAGPFGAVLTDEGAPGTGDNLVLKAARGLAAAADCRAGAALTLIKRLPVASGIGGGSADAAAALSALACLWDVDLDAAALSALALSLGADVPVCLAGRAAQMGGVGELVAPAVGLPPCAVVLVNPLRPLPTPVVFKARNGAFSRAAPLDRPPPDARALAEALMRRGNDLTAPAVALMPEIATVLASLAGQPACLLARMSGSGATCFGLFADLADAQAAAWTLQGAQPRWWIRAARLLTETAALEPSLDAAG